MAIRDWTNQVESVCLIKLLVPFFHQETAHPRLCQHCMVTSETALTALVMAVTLYQLVYQYRMDSLTLNFVIFVTKHGFLSSVEAEIISFCQRRQPFAFSAFYYQPLTFGGGSPSKFDK